MNMKERISAALLKIPPFRDGIDLAPMRGSVSHERWERVEKIRECMTLKEQNRELRETVIKQRIALDALTQANREDAKCMEDQLAALRYQISAISAERDRYRAALRRLFPEQGQEAAG